MLAFVFCQPLNCITGRLLTRIVLTVQLILNWRQRGKPRFVSSQLTERLRHFDVLPVFRPMDNESPRPDEAGL
jgi:hypothetical protein